MTMKLAKSPNIHAFTLILALFLTCAHAANVTIDYVDASGADVILVNNNDSDRNQIPDDDASQGVMDNTDPDIIKFEVTTTRKSGTISLKVDQEHQSNVKIWADAKKETSHAMSWEINSTGLAAATGAPVDQIDSKIGYFWVEGLVASEDFADKIKIDAALSDTDFDTVEFLIVKIDIDYNNDGILDNKSDFLPGYEFGVPVLHTGNSYKTASYSSPQEVRIYVTPQMNQVSFAITGATEYEGYCKNGFRNAPGGKDVSFNSNGDDSAEDAISFAGASTVMTYWKDYGGWCNISILVNGEAISSFNLPEDSDNDNIADKWQLEQIGNWNYQYNANLATELTSWREISQDDEKADPDENGLLYPHEFRGDGLFPHYNEYRGYIVDGGYNMGSCSHLRLDVARKELLVEVSQQSGINNSIASGTNAGLAYTLESSLTDAIDFYSDNYGIYTYWVADEVGEGGSDVSWRNNLYVTTEAANTKVDGSGVNLGGPNFVIDDRRLEAIDPTAYALLFDPATPTDFFNRMNRGPDLDGFIKLRLTSRECMYLPKRDSNNNIIPGDYIYWWTERQISKTTETGSRIEVAALAEEAITGLRPEKFYDASEFPKVLSYSIAHECGHSFFGILDVSCEDGDLMSHNTHPHGDGINGVGTSETECAECNLLDRTSAH